jgi:hypothetical protein
MSVSIQDQLGDRLQALEAENQRLRENALQLLRALGSPHLCGGCRAQVWRVYHARGRRDHLYGPDAAVHDCPAPASEYRRAIEEGR